MVIMKCDECGKEKESSHAEVSEASRLKLKDWRVANFSQTDAHPFGTSLAYCSSECESKYLKSQMKKIW